LRKRLDKLEPGSGSLITTSSEGISLSLAPERLDSARFKRCYETGAEAFQRADYARAANVLRDGLRLWRGPAYEGLIDLPLAGAAARSLDAMRTAAHVTRIEADLFLGRHRDLIDELKQLTEGDPGNEHLIYLLVLATYRDSGAEAAAAICRDRLSFLRSMGIDAPQLVKLQVDVLRRSPELDLVPAPQRIFKAPPSIRAFTGRSELLEQMRQELENPAGGMTAITLFGLGGVGKSRLATEYAHRYANDYSLVFWVPADEPVGIVTRLSELAERLGIPAGDRSPDMLASLWERLRVLDTQWLLIYDDADGPEALSLVWPLGGPGHVIVTSRNRNWGRIATPVKVEPLSRTESVLFIAKRLRREVDAGDAGAIASELGDLPLALEHSCAFLDATDIPIAEYLELIRDGDTYQLLGRGAVDDAEQTVATTWDVSLRMIRSKEPAAEQLLRLCAFLSPSGISKAVIRAHAASLPEPLARMAREPLSFHRIIEVIGRYSLAEVTSEQIGMHPLVQAVVRATLDPDEITLWAGAALHLIDAAYPENEAEQAGPDLIRHAVVATRYGRLHEVDADAVQSLLTKAARSASSRGDAQQVVQLLSGALDADGGPGQVATSRTADILILLGSAYRVLGLLDDAFHCYSEAVEVRKREYGSDGLPVAEPLTGLGLIFFDRGHLEGAREHLLASLAITERHDAVDELAVATTHSVLGLVLWRLHDLPGAKAALETALKLRRGRLSEGHQSIATSLDNLAKVIFDLGDSLGAKEMNEQALRIREAQLGSDHYHVAISLNHLGFVLRDLGDLDEALGAHQRALDIFRTRLGSRHSHVARSIQGIGAVNRAQGVLPAARQAFQEALDIFTDSLGADHTETALCLSDLGGVLALLGDMPQAREVMVRAFSVISARLPTDHPDYVRIHEQLAGLNFAAPPA
jgi:tetratricopeptide (TPR) repeat protein